MQVLAAGFVACALSLAGSMPVWAQDVAAFPDVPRDHWASIAVERLSQAGIVEGLAGGSFEGQRPMTRYEFGVAMARILEWLGRGSMHGEPPFSDVPRKHWAFWALGKASHFGVVEGRADGRFAGDSYITRYSSAVAYARVMSRVWEDRFNPLRRDPLGRAPRKPEPEPKTMMFVGEMFRDVPANHWTRSAIERVTTAGIFEGDPDDRFHGERPLSRYEFVVSVTRLVEHSVEIG